MKLRFYRLMETIFSWPAAYFGDLADSIDIELHERLRDSMKQVQGRMLTGKNNDREV